MDMFVPRPSASLARKTQDRRWLDACRGLW